MLHTVSLFKQYGSITGEALLCGFYQMRVVEKGRSLSEFKFSIFSNLQGYNKSTKNERNVVNNEFERYRGKKDTLRITLKAQNYDIIRTNTPTR